MPYVVCSIVEAHMTWVGRRTSQSGQWFDYSHVYMCNIVCVHKFWNACTPQTRTNRLISLMYCTHTLWVNTIIISCGHSIVCRVPHMQRNMFVKLNSKHLTITHKFFSELILLLCFPQRPTATPETQFSRFYNASFSTAWCNCLSGFSSYVSRKRTQRWNYHNSPPSPEHD